MQNAPLEKLIRLADVPTLDWLPDRGKPIHLATVYRWVQRGIRGQRLRVVHVGGGMATRESWLFEFFSRLGGEARTIPAPTGKQRRREMDRADVELEAIGI